MESITFSLPSYDGPLDLLLNLISKHKLDIYNIPIASLCDQYMAHIRTMKLLDMEIATEFTRMASRLVYIKTAMLLPKHEDAEQLSEELTGELLEYQLCKEMAERLGELSKECNTFVRQPLQIEWDKSYRGHHRCEEILSAFLSAAGRGLRKLPPPSSSFSEIVVHKTVSVSSRIVYVLRRLWTGKPVALDTIYHASKSRSEMVATFLAVLELLKANRIQLRGKGMSARVNLLGRNVRDGTKQVQISS